MTILRALALALCSAAVLAVPAVAADHPLLWPGCCSNGEPPRQIDPGDTVTFTGDFSSHPLVWDFEDFPTESGGPASRQFAFPTSGTYPFHCQFHSNMVGTIKVGANAAPTAADFTFSPSAPVTGEIVTFTATASDSDGSVASYLWDLDGNGSYERSTAGASTTRSYTAAGTYSVKVRVRDNGHDLSAAVAKDVIVTAAPATGEPTQPPADPGPGPAPGTGTPDPEPVPGATADMTAPAASDLSVRGRFLRLRLSEAATLTGVVRRGTRTVRRLRAELGAGARSVRLGRRPLRPGRYSVRFTLTDAAGNASRRFVVRFRMPA